MLSFIFYNNHNIMSLLFNSLLCSFAKFSKSFSISHFICLMCVSIFTPLFFILTNLFRACILFSNIFLVILPIHLYKSHCCHIFIYLFFFSTELIPFFVIIDILVLLIKYFHFLSILYTLKIEMRQTMAKLSTRKRDDKWNYRFEGAKGERKRKQISKGDCLHMGRVGYSNTRKTQFCLGAPLFLS